MADTTRVPESLDLRVVHERCNGSAAAAGAIVRVIPEPVAGWVHLHMTTRIGAGMVTLRLLLPPQQARNLKAMIDDALMLLGERHA